MCAAVCGSVQAGTGLKLHRPSPDWRDQILYFALTDRFADGDPSNNDQGAGEFQPDRESHYNGGDLRGLRQRLDYIHGLGVTGLWITPPVANQWLDPAGGYTGYHGYWAENFLQVDRHLGDLREYQQLSDALHRAGMVLVQDIVVNHTGNYFAYGGDWRAEDPTLGYEPHDRTAPVARPSQPPFDLNDPRDPGQRAAGIYHWTPDISRYQDANQEHNFQMSGLDDLNTENPRVRRALRQSYGHWIRSVGVDAFRVDTAFYVPPAYFDDFLHARDVAAPGMAEVARQTGRRQFFAFGEGFAIDRPGQDQAMRKIEGYVRDPQGRDLLPGMLNFPLYGALGDAFARGRPPAELGERIALMMRLHARPHHLVNFIDNHDVDRFLAGGSAAGMQQALLALMTLPGIPVIYYGTEQAYTEPRAAMFAAGYRSGGRDRYDTQAPLYRAIAAMTALRRGHRLFSRGRPAVLSANAAQAGALAYAMTHRGQAALVAFNTADSETVLPQLATGWPAGTVLQGLFGLDGLPAPVRVGPGGRLNLRLPPRAGWVWLKTGLKAKGASAATRAAAERTVAALTPVVDRLPVYALTGDFAVTGWAPGGPDWRLVVDGDLARGLAVAPGPDGRWAATVDTATMVDPDARHSLTLWAEGAAAAPREFQVRRDWDLRVDVADPAGDDVGPSGQYRYPTDAGWGDTHQLDLRRVRVFEAGGALQIEITMAGMSAGWNPANGFDRVAFTAFIELPGREGGATVMPLQNATLPGGMRWHLRWRAGGWSNALFGPEGATATSEGQVLTPAPTLVVDRDSRRLRLTLSAAVLGRLPSLRGARLYITTWDYDGGYRVLAPQAGAYAFGGGAADQAKVMDDSVVIVLP